MKRNIIYSFIAIIAFSGSLSLFSACDEDESAGSFTVIVKLNDELVSGAIVALSENVTDYNNNVYLKGPVTTGTDGIASFGELETGTYYLGAEYTDGVDYWYGEYELTMGTSDFELNLNLSTKK